MPSYICTSYSIPEYFGDLPAPHRQNVEDRAPRRRPALTQRLLTCSLVLGATAAIVLLLCRRVQRLTFKTYASENWLPVLVRHQRYPMCVACWLDHERWCRKLKARRARTRCGEKGNTSLRSYTDTVLHVHVQMLLPERWTTAVVVVVFQTHTDRVDRIYSNCRRMQGQATKLRRLPDNAQQKPTNRETLQTMAV